MATNRNKANISDALEKAVWIISKQVQTIMQDVFRNKTILDARQAETVCLYTKTLASVHAEAEKAILKLQNKSYGELSREEMKAILLGDMRHEEEYAAIGQVDPIKDEIDNDE